MDEVQGPSHDDAIARLEAKLREAVELLKPFALYGSFGGEDCYNVRVLSQDARAALTAIEAAGMRVVPEDHTPANVALRDAFIVREGLWQKFIDHLSSAAQKDSTSE